MSKILNLVYKMVLDEDFEYGSFEKRLKLQKTVYLLENLGVNVGNYGFTWYKHGPYSQELQDDAYYGSSSECTSLSDDAKDKIVRLKRFVSECKGTPYSAAFWLEDIASLYYLKYRMKLEQDELLPRLIKEKSHLDNQKLNERALEIIDEINALVA